MDWIDCQDRFSREDEGLPQKEEEPLTGYGVHRDIQDALARLRTDLDSFSDTEAHALMCSAYLMTRLALGTEDSVFAKRADIQAEWRFLRIEPHLKSPQGFRAGVPLSLRVGEQLPFKVWRLSPWLTTLSTALLIALGLAGVYLLAAFAERMGSIQATARLTPFLVVVGTCTVVAVLATLRWTLRTYGRAGELVERGTIGVVTVLLLVPMWLHRRIIDRIFLRRGRYDQS